MESSIPDSLSAILDSCASPAQTLVVQNSQSPPPLINMLEKAFADQPVSVTRRDAPDGDENVVLLETDGEVVARSPFEALESALLLVNVDRYRTGTRQGDTAGFPDVLTALSDTEFTVRGFPASNNEKLLLVMMSRAIEHRALAADHGRLHATFQELSRLDDEYGTRTMYRRLAESDVTTHLYGVPDDYSAAADLDATVHTGETAAYRRTWIVLFHPDESTGQSGNAADPAALVAFENGENRWRGMWTYDPSLVARTHRYIRQAF